nr:hypothetical protein [Dyadobacter alkalitolerans]
MNHPHYVFKYGSKKNTFSFISLGKRGRIKKIVQFRLIENNVYNLGFGDYSEEFGTLDDQVVTDNGDMEKSWQPLLLLWSTSLREILKCEFSSQAAHHQEQDYIKS